MKDIVLKLNDVDFSYGRDKIFNNFNLEVYNGDFVAIVGPNGSGKSTLVKLILNQLQPQRGNIMLFEADVASDVDFTKIGYVPQLGVENIKEFPISVKELVSLSLYPELKRFRPLDKSQIKRIEESLLMVNLKDKADELFGRLSGGQRQRVLIAKALISRPQLLILDEPTTGIDKKNRDTLYEILHHINKDHNVTIVMITHYLDESKDLVNKVVELENLHFER